MSHFETFGARGEVIPSGWLGEDLVDLLSMWRSRWTSVNCVRAKGEKKAVGLIDPSKPVFSKWVAI